MGEAGPVLWNVGGVLGMNFIFLWIAVFPIGVRLYLNVLGAGHVVGLLIPVVVMA